MNITNFIDGSDGYLSVNAISFLFGILIINYFLPEKYFSYYLAIVLLPILLSFFISTNLKTNYIWVILEVF